MAPLGVTRAEAIRRAEALREAWIRADWAEGDRLAEQGGWGGSIKLWETVRDAAAAGCRKDPEGARRVAAAIERGAELRRQIQREMDRRLQPGFDLPEPILRAEIAAWAPGRTEELKTAAWLWIRVAASSWWRAPALLALCEAVPDWGLSPGPRNEGWRREELTRRWREGRGSLVSVDDLRERAGLAHDSLRALVQIGALKDPALAAREMEDELAIDEPGGPAVVSALGRWICETDPSAARWEIVMERVERLASERDAPGSGPSWAWSWVARELEASRLSEAAGQGGQNRPAAAEGERTEPLIRRL
jgi:hypothetical protein